MNNSLHTRAGTKKLWRFVKHIVYETMPFFVGIAVLSVLGGITWAVIYFDILDWAGPCPTTPYATTERSGTSGAKAKKPRSGTSQKD